MPYKPKGRIEKQAALNAKRKESRKLGFDGPVILLGTKGGLTRKKIAQIIERVKEKREAHFKEKIPYIRSADKALIGKWSNATATDVAMRISKRYLIKPLKAMKLSQSQIEIVSRIILRRSTQTIPGTNIEVRQPLEFNLIELANAFGENGHEKAKRALEIVGKRGKNIFEMSNKTKTPSDMFVNVYQRVHSFAATLEYIAPKEMAQVMPSLIKERQEEIERLKTMNITNKETIIKKMEQEVQKARREYVRYRVNHSLII